MVPLPSRVAIVVRTKDRPLLLRRALADVAAQEFGDWRLVIVNDGGDPAGVEELLADLDAELRERIAVLHHAEPLGMEAASNAGLAATSGEYVCIHDDDDTWEPTFLATTVAHLDAHPEDAAVVTRTEIVYEEIHGSHVVETGRGPFWNELPAISLSDLLRTNRFVPIQLLYRRSVHDELGPYRADLPVVGDWEFNLRLARAHTIGLIDEVLAYWHQRPQARGSMRNSVAADQAQAAADLRIRDQLLKEHVAAHGMGDLLYLTRYLQGEFDHLHRRLTELDARLGELEGRLDDTAGSDALTGRLDLLGDQLLDVEHAVGESGVIGFARRKYHALRSRMRRRR
ncbi:MAG: glycosyltransferase family 2 protein [Nigerium sp.]|nr:glycosyltransferase family 2 protein [Nigerium sp.]